MSRDPLENEMLHLKGLSLINSNSNVRVREKVKLLGHIYTTYFIYNIVYYNIDGTGFLKSITKWPWFITMENVAPVTFIIYWQATCATHSTDR